MSHTGNARAQKLEVDFSLAKTETREKNEFLFYTSHYNGQGFSSELFAMVIIQ